MVEETKEEYKPTYWNKKGKYQKEYDRLYKKLVPPKGKSKTTDGELLRCISRFYYEKYNNGFSNDKSYEIEFVNSFAWDADLNIHISETMSEQELDETVDKIIEYLLEKEKEEHENEIEIDKIIKMAENFECCPYCGNLNLDSEHSCNVCKKRFPKPDDAYWFAEYLKKKYNKTYGGGDDGNK